MPPFFVDGLPIGLFVKSIGKLLSFKASYKDVPFNFRRVILIWT